MGPYLLDVNVLIAMFDRKHPHHDAVQNWFSGIGPSGWRTCPITESGLIRVMSNPNVSSYSAGWVAAELEKTKTRAAGYEFWADDFSVSSWFQTIDQQVPSSKVTDVYLLGLAIRKKGLLATLDRGIRAELIGYSGESVVEQIPA